MRIQTNFDKNSYEEIGSGNNIFTIAEIGLNHNNNLSLAKKMIDAAKEAGCSSVKFQNFNTDDVYVGGDKAGKYNLLGKKIEIYDLHKSLEISLDMIKELHEYSSNKNIIFFSSPIGIKSLDDLDEAGVNLYKISSYEISNLPFLSEAASRKKPIIMSTGGATLSEVERALDTIYNFHSDVSLMHCLIKYPANFEDANLKIMNTLKEAFGIPVGFSNNGFRDSNGDIDFSKIPSAVSNLGADLYEIHITLDRKMEGVDQGFSTEPNELKKMIKLMNDNRKKFLEGQAEPVDEDLLGSGIKRTLEADKYVRRFAYKCIFSTKPIKKGDFFNESNIKTLRPGESDRGLEPLFYELILNKAKAKRNISENEPINWADIF